MEFVNPVQKPLKLSTSGGNLSLSVPAEFKAELMASTFDGSVDCALPLEEGLDQASFQQGETQRGRAYRHFEHLRR